MFFLEKLKCLHKAALIGYQALRAECLKVMDVVDAVYPSLQTFKDAVLLQALEKDQLSQALLPLDLSQHLIPLKCIGDGNCLFRYDT